MGTVVRSRIRRGSISRAWIVVGIVTLSSAGLATAGHLNCGDVVGPGLVKLDADLACNETNASPAALTVGANGTKIDLNGFTISCTGSGYQGSCQGLGHGGIRTDGFSRVTIAGPGTIAGFTAGVFVHGGSDITVRNLVVTGPSDPTQRPEIAQGIEVTMVECPTPPDFVVHIRRNEVSNHLIGIDLGLAGCVDVSHNYVHHNRSDIHGPSVGINVEVSDRNRIAHNRVEKNGAGVVNEAGIKLDGSAFNRVIGNDASDNDGHGILAQGMFQGGSHDNVISNNEARHNSLFDLAAENAGTGNLWHSNNHCLTQGGSGPNLIPPGVCNPGE